MADFIYSEKSSDIFPLTRFKRLYADSKVATSTSKLKLFGHKGNVIYIEKGDDFIAILGYCYCPGESTRATASRILNTFEESMIKELKCTLVGQFVIIIKKNNLMYFLSDCMQVGGLFYSDDLSVLSSSFSVIEEAVGSDKSNLNFYKVFEYVAMRQIEYPSWLGSKTMHKKVMRLRSYEYIVIDMTGSASRVGGIGFTINNEKERDIRKISTDLTTRLKSAIENPDLKDAHVVATLTGGYDSRLVCTLAANYFNDITFRICSSKISKSKKLDDIIAKKVAEAISRPLRYYQATENYDDVFYLLTEGMSPSENSLITPAIEDSGSFSLGLGGCYGTELFAPVDYESVEDFIDQSILKAKRNIQANQEMWETLRSAMKDEFQAIGKHYKLAVACPNDEIRIFNLFNTGFFSSHMVWPCNVKGLAFEPYMSMKNLELALKVTKEQMGRWRNFSGIGQVQKNAMAKLCYRVGKIETTHYGPMVPCTIRSFPSYLFYYLQHVSFTLSHKLKAVMEKVKLTKISHNTVHINDLSYVSNGWDRLFLRRLKEKYSVEANIQ
jgi:hypothetical protein